MPTPLFKPSAGYRRLDAYALANIVQLATLAFCRRFLNRDNDPAGRQFAQMTQAARSGVKNITEGSERLKTSVSSAITLLDVARASLCELRDDYTTWLMDANQCPWRQSSDEARAVFDVRLAPANFGDDINHDCCARILAEKQKFARWLDAPDSAVRANALLIIISRTLHMLENLIARHGETFREEGGFHERMATVRTEARREQKKPLARDAPPCPLCGEPTRLRHGKNGDFWGCAAYPTCKGTRRIPPAATAAAAAAPHSPAPSNAADGIR
jgi:four helix bundle suffix protein